VRKQLAETRLLFGGGGFCRDPYEASVRNKFGRPWIVGKCNPDIVGMPLPKDLDLPYDKSSWMKRLFVAYGLSFFRGDLARHMFAEEVEDVPAEERMIRHDGIIRAPTKDDC